MENPLAKILSNRINKFSVEIRQHLGDIKQISHKAKESNQLGELEDDLNKIINLCEQALNVLKRFEEETTEEKLLPTPESTPEP